MLLINAMNSKLLLRIALTGVTRHIPPKPASRAAISHFKLDESEKVSTL